MMITTFMFMSIVFTQTGTVPDVWIDEIDSIPDLMQTDERANFHGGGVDFCAPASVSNSLAFLASKDYPHLLPKSGPSFESHVAMVKRLASKDYMNTDGGTSVERTVHGIRKYVTENGYEIRGLEYRGLKLYYKSGEAPESTLAPLDWLRRGLYEPGGVWLQIGWYDYDMETDQFKKKGGHFVTLVGYGVDESGAVDPKVLIVHDPSPRSGIEFANEYVTIQSLSSGLIGGYGIPQPAKGYYKLSGGLDISEVGDTAILEGAIILSLKPPKGERKP
jgi:hypothetical protein